ncbi:uncharacterized protein LOC127861485 isoform X2 [Dreissena polymorpha]|uniref:RING-type domain-containing protein n=1 Tax=Dreissena polymorpha TaxID=45954 RepID=A0A9D4BJB6_DREPO|nr:uncharacterized protein LOC127861485 isoform X2 [Dreissena polymorpha]KAH3695483.1 hypothetical protein DPMN_082943 [Dreissena polymorpha]
MASLISTIGDLLLCPVCKEVLRQPRTLPCQHSLCHDCLKTLISNIDRLEQSHGDFPCPVCRSVTKLPKASSIEIQVVAFPINRLVLSMMDAITQHNDDWPKCKLHPDKSADLVCVTHDILVCSKCILTSHRHCRVLDMNDYVKSTYYTTKCNDISENLKRYRSHLGLVMDEITTKIDDVSRDEENVILELKCLRDTFNSAFDSLEERILTKGMNLKKQGVSCLQKQRTMLQELRTDLDTSLGEVKEANESDIPSKRLLALRTAEANLKMVDMEMGSVSLPLTTFKLQVSAKMEACMVMLKDAVDVVTEERSFEIPPLPPSIVTHPQTPRKSPAQSRNKRPPTDVCAVKVNAFGVRMHNDKSPCDVTGSAVMADGRLVLVDYNNKKLKVLDSDFKLISDFKTDGASFDATEVAKNQVAVTVPKEKKIHFLSLQDGMKVSDSIQTRLECWGIDTVDDKLVTVTNSDDHMILFLNRKGIELISCSLGSQDPNMKWPISVCAESKDRIYVSCQGEGDSEEINGCLVVIDAAAQVRSMYMDPGLRKPTSCTRDDEGNVFICGLTSANVHIIQKSGDRLGQVISGLSKPIHVKFCPNSGSVLLMERFCNDVSVYQMQE